MPSILQHEIGKWLLSYFLSSFWKRLPWDLFVWFKILIHSDPFNIRLAFIFNIVYTWNPARISFGWKSAHHRIIMYLGRWSSRFPDWSVRSRIKILAMGFGGDLMADRGRFELNTEGLQISEANGVRHWFSGGSGFTTMASDHRWVLLAIILVYAQYT